jgi:hypothetical protein
MYSNANPSTTASLGHEFSSVRATPSAVKAEVVWCQAVSKGGPVLCGQVAASVPVMGWWVRVRGGGGV